MGGVPGVAPASVLVIGAGVAGMAAVRLSKGMGAEVVLLDQSISKLRYATEQMGGGLVTELIQESVLKSRLQHVEICF